MDQEIGKYTTFLCTFLYYTVTCNLGKVTLGKLGGAGPFTYFENAAKLFLNYTFISYCNWLNNKVWYIWTCFFFEWSKIKEFSKDC